jgi:hypothetical protein
MSEDWQFFPCAIGDYSAFIFVDVGIKNTIITAPKILAKIYLTYKHPHPNGLPTNEEFEPVKNLENRLEQFSESGGDWYVGRTTFAGHRHFYVYTKRDQDSWKDFVATLASESGYELRVSLQEDPNHALFYDELYPTPDDWRVIKDLRVIEILEKHGDDGSLPRKIDHWIYFPDKQASVDFVIWAESDRFTEEPERSHITDDGKYCVRLYHQGIAKINDISNLTMALQRKAAEFGGDYDGWETVVLKNNG